MKPIKEKEVIIECPECKGEMFVYGKTKEGLFKYFCVECYHTLVEIAKGTDLISAGVKGAEAGKVLRKTLLEEK